NDRTSDGLSRGVLVDINSALQLWASLPAGNEDFMKPNPDQNLERIFESAVVVSWKDLMTGGPQTGSVNVEYGFDPSGIVEYVKVWKSIPRSSWFLVCSYWMSASTLHAGGVRFDNGY